MLVYGNNCAIGHQYHGSDNYARNERGIWYNTSPANIKPTKRNSTFDRKFEGHYGSENNGNGTHVNTTSLANAKGISWGNGFHLV